MKRANLDFQRQLTLRGIGLPLRNESCEFGSPKLRVSLAHPVHFFTVTASVVIVQEKRSDVRIKIGQERARILEGMKESLVRGDDDKALEYARQLTGLPPKQSTAFLTATYNDR